MVEGMASIKVTVTLPEQQVHAVRQLVSHGQALSVSGFVQHAVGLALDDIDGWGLLLTQALFSTGGELTEDERRWADSVLAGGGSGEAA